LPQKSIPTIRSRSTILLSITVTIIVPNSKHLTQPFDPLLQKFPILSPFLQCSGSKGYPRNALSNAPAGAAFETASPASMIKSVICSSKMSLCFASFTLMAYECLCHDPIA
jgi:hypothetical protein